MRAANGVASLRTALMRLRLGGGKWGPAMLVDPETRLLAAMQRNKPVLAGHRRHERLAEAKDERTPEPGYVRTLRNVPAVQKPRLAPVSAAERREMARLYDELGRDTEPEICRRIAERLDSGRSSLCVATILSNDGVRGKLPKTRTVRKRGAR
jgi:hypothetical protein